VVERVVVQAGGRAVRVVLAQLLGMDSAVLLFGLFTFARERHIKFKTDI
jgi:hypothetical protein